jgi:hypothetical protein
MKTKFLLVITLMNFCLVSSMRGHFYSFTTENYIADKVHNGVMINDTGSILQLKGVNTCGVGVVMDMMNPIFVMTNGPTCSVFTNRTTIHGLGNNRVYDVYVVGSTVYAATDGGLSISTDGGSSFTNRTTADGLGHNVVFGVYVDGSNVYAATDGGVSISTDGGSSFTNRTTANGLGSNNTLSVYADGSNIYVGTGQGASISTNGGSSFTNNFSGHPLTSEVYAVGSTVYKATNGGLGISTNGGGSYTFKTTANGLGSNVVNGVYVVGSNVYAATQGGLSISTDGGNTFTNKTTFQGLGFNSCLEVYAIGSTIYVSGGGLNISTDGGNSFTNYTQSNGLGGFIVDGLYATATSVYAATSGGFSYCSTASVPAAPTNLVATPCGGQVAISFTAGADGGSPITNYQYTMDGTSWSTFSPAVTGTTVTITALSSGTYNISLRAVNSVGSGVSSTTVTATIDTNANVSVAYTGATIVIATNKSAPITLSATVTLPGCATASQAELRFIDRDSGQPISGWLPITPGTPPNTGTATYPHILTLGTNEIFRKYNIGFEIGGAGIFTRNVAADKVAVTVAEPSCGCY